MGSLLLPAHTCRSTGVGIADSAMPYTYRSISPEIRSRNGKDFHSPIKSRNFVLTVLLDGVRAPPSVCFNIQVYNIRSRKTDTDCIEIFVRKSPASRCTSSHFIFVMRFSTGRERRLIVNLFSSRPPRTFAAGFANREGFCEVPQSSLGGSDDPCFSARRRIFRTEIKRAFHIRTERIAIIRFRHFASHCCSYSTATVPN